MSRYYDVAYLDQNGLSRKRMFFLPSRQDVRREVAAFGGSVQSIKDKRRTWFNREYYSRGFKAAFFKAIEFHLEVGSSSAQSLLHVIETEPHPAKRADMQPSLEVLSRGGRFADAVALLPFVDKPILSMLQAGDLSGTTKESLADAISLLDSRQQTWKILTGALSWIALDIVSMVSTVYSIQFAAIPYLRKARPQTNSLASTQHYMAQLDRVELFNMFLLAGTSLVAVLIAATAYLLIFGSTEIKDKIYEKIATIPILRSLFIDSSMADGFLMLSRMTKNGVPTLKVLEVIETFGSVGSIRRFWNNVRKSIEAGWDMRQAFRGAGMLLEREMIAITSHQNRDQLVRITEVMAENRRDLAKAGAARFIRITIGIAIAYMVIVMLVAIWLVVIQDGGLSSSFEGLMKGGV